MEARAWSRTHPHTHTTPQTHHPAVHTPTPTHFRTCTPYRTVAGQAPSEEAEREWYRMEQQMLERHEVRRVYVCGCVCYVTVRVRVCVFVCLDVRMSAPPSPCV